MKEEPFSPLEGLEYLLQVAFVDLDVPAFSHPGSLVAGGPISLSVPSFCHDFDGFLAFRAQKRACRAFFQGYQVPAFGSVAEGAVQGVPPMVDSAVDQDFDACIEFLLGHHFP